MSVWTVGAALGLYALLLFAVGWWAQKRPVRRAADASVLAALSIGVYCTSWTFYGAVGSAARSGWDYLPIYLGPILAFTLGLRVVRKTVALGKAHGATSLPDLLSRRFGRSGRLAALVTLTATIVSIPYIALQLIAVASTFSQVTGSAEPRPPVVVVSIAAVLAGFALLFGIRDRDMTAANPGLVGAIAFDSVFKLLAFAAVAFTALIAAADSFPAAAMPAELPPLSADRFIVLTMLSAFAVLCLPRQFQMTVVEVASERQVREGAPLVVAYLAAFAILVLPLAAAGRALIPGTDPDLFVLTIPNHLGLGALEIFAFTGGFAAAASMVIVAGVALSAMVTTDLVLPIVSLTEGQSRFRRVVLIRRVILCILIALSTVFALIVPIGSSLAGIGVVAFAGAGQFAPLLIAALYIPRVSERGAVCGLLAGITGWAGFVIGPAFFTGTAIDWSGPSAALLPFVSDDFTRGALLSLTINAAAIAVVSALAPISLKAHEDAARFGAMSPTLASGGNVRVADLWELMVQIVGEAEAGVLFNGARQLSPKDPAPKELLADAEAKLSRVLGSTSANILISRLLAAGRVEAGDVMILMGDASRELRFGQELLSATLENLAEGVSVIDGEGKLVAWNRAYQDLFQYPEGLLAVGTPLEQLLRHNLPDISDEGVAARIDKLLEGRPHNAETRLRDGRIVRLQGRPVPGGGYVTSFSDVTEYREAQAALRESEEATRFYTDNVPFPIGFSDQRQVLRFHNRAFADMVRRPGADLTGEHLSSVFADRYALRQPSIEAVLRGHGRRFVLSPDEIGGEVTWQVTYVPQFASDGSVAGFFGFYQDISKRRAVQAALEEANRSLESRVDRRTRELRHANEELQQAREAAEAANRSKTRFLAAASHDVLQPLNAARLFASSLEDDLPADSDEAAMAKKIGAAIVSADTLLRSLLNLSKLEAGGVDPKRAPLELGQFLDGIVEEFRPLAEGKGLALRSVPTGLVTRTDAGLLRSALQNLISNAIRYTDRGGVLIGVRRRGDGLTIDIVDTGRGLDEDEIPQIFEEFARLKRDRDVDGAGLGLATVRRITDLLDHPVEVSSEPNRGTVFRLLMPRLKRQVVAVPRSQSAAQSLAGRRVLCVDNDKSVLEALKERFDRWGAETDAYSGLAAVREAYANGAALPDLLVLDYQLDDGQTGLEIADFLRDEKGASCPGIVVTASRSEETDLAIASKGLAVLPKPVEPAALRALSVSLLSGRTE